MYYYPSESFKLINRNIWWRFFKEHILLFYYKYEPNISNYVHSVVKKDNTLTLNVNCFKDVTILSSSALIVIKKADISVLMININIRTIATTR